MTITNIIHKKQKLSDVYIDGEFAVKIDTETMLLSNFTVGCQIDDEQLKDLIDKSNEKRSKEKALWLLSFRDHSKKELKDKLKKTSDDKSAELAVSRMEELGLINDEKFAQRHANELLNVKHLSKKGALYKLIEKGVDKELACNVLEEFDFDPKEHIEIIINKKYANDIHNEKGKRRIIAKLQRMGYSWSDISAVLNIFLEDEYL